MGVHPKLRGFSRVKHIKVLSKYLKGIEKDLEKLGCTDFDVEIIPFGPSRSFLGKLFLGPNYKKPGTILGVSAEVHGCPVAILVPIAERGVTMPYAIRVELPVPMTGRAEYIRGTFGNKWHCEPKNRRLIADLKRSLPKVEMKHQHQVQGLAVTYEYQPVTYEYQLNIGYCLEPTADGKTEWIIHSAYRGGMLTGGYRPRIHKYLEVIPAVEALLRKHG
jgi:hypothetical protein